MFQTTNQAVKITVAQHWGPYGFQYKKKEANATPNVRILRSSISLLRGAF